MVARSSVLYPHRQWPTRHDPGQPKQSTSATYQRLFPAANNLVTIEFDHYAHGGNRADGMAVVLSDARVTPARAFGGPLGYGFKTRDQRFCRRLDGVGIDEYGNYANEGLLNPGLVLRPFPFVAPVPVQGPRAIAIWQERRAT